MAYYKRLINQPAKLLIITVLSNTVVAVIRDVAILQMFMHV